MRYPHNWKKEQGKQVCTDCLLEVDDNAWLAVRHSNCPVKHMAAAGVNIVPPAEPVADAAIVLGEDTADGNVD